MTSIASAFGDYVPCAGWLLHMSVEGIDHCFIVMAYHSLFAQFIFEKRTLEQWHSIYLMIPYLVERIQCINIPLFIVGDVIKPYC